MRAAGPARGRGSARGVAFALALGVACGCAARGGVAGPDACGGAPRVPSLHCVVAGPQYAASAPHRWLLGAGYRDLWTAAVLVPVLELERAAGGLEPVERLGRGQSETLALRGGDGRAYSFRSTDKDNRRAAGALGRLAPVAAAYRDQAAAGHPGAPLVASVIARAAGVLEPERRLVVLAATPRLARFDDFAGRLGTFEEHPTPAAPGRPGSFGALEVVRTEALLGLLEADPRERADPRAYLRARLVDLVLGDADRHPGQWRFARLEPGGAWQPLPEDRDLALARFDGLLLRVSRPWFPLLGVFDEHIDVDALAAQAVVTDAWLLAPLARPAWREEAAAVQARLGPEVVERALAALPPAWRALDGARTARRLRARIAALATAAETLYERLAREVDVHGSAAAERVVATAGAGGTRTLRVVAHGLPDPRFARVVDLRETQRVRLCGFDARDAFAVEALEPIDVVREPRCEPRDRPLVIEPPASDSTAATLP